MKEFKKKLYLLPTTEKKKLSHMYTYTNTKKKKKGRERETHLGHTHTQPPNWVLFEVANSTYPH
jgi:hypothetical protein